MHTWCCTCSIGEGRTGSRCLISMLLCHVLFVCNVRGPGSLIVCESCTWPICTRPSMEGGEVGLSRQVCFVARGFELAAIVGLLCFYRYDLSATQFQCLRYCFFCFIRTRPTVCIWQGLPYLPISPLRGTELRTYFHYVLFVCCSHCISAAFVAFTDCKGCT